MKFHHSHLHEALGAAGQLAGGTKARFVTIHVRVDHALIEAAHRKAIKDDLQR